MKYCLNVEIFEFIINIHLIKMKFSFKILSLRCEVSVDVAEWGWDGGYKVVGN